MRSRPTNSIRHSRATGKAARLLAGAAVFGAALLACGAEPVAVDNASSTAEEARKFFSELEKAYAQMLKSGTDADGNPQPYELPAAAPVAKGDAGEVERFAKLLLTRMAESRNDCLRNLQAVGFDLILNPPRLSADPTLRESKAIMRNATAVTARCKEISFRILDGIPDVVSKLKVSEGMRTGAQRGVAEGLQAARPGIEAQWEFEFATLKEFDGMIEFLASRQGHWRVGEGQMVFETSDDVAEYNARMAGIRAVIAEALALLKQRESFAMGKLAEASRMSEASGHASKGDAFVQERKFAEAAAEYGEAVRLAPALAGLRFARGASLYFMKDDAGAIAELDEAIRLDPGMARAYGVRAGALVRMGESERAIPDLDKVISLTPPQDSAYRVRAMNHFALGHFELAEQDYVRALAIKPLHYASIWLYLAQARQGKGEGDLAALAASAKREPANKWPEPVMRYYLGGVSDAELLAAAVSPADSKQKTDQECEAVFYIGERAMLRGDAAQARPRFERARTICPKDFNEYTAAVGELKRLGPP